ncbi:uncharacterized protein LOC106873077 [Octopus bimaculoides]|uniref:SWIM-type domain-containing protein n=1 Tax=Octopus bimaculoides TaxID=37653 RepID=A0A0L8H4M2_OCTBM|nr:uncharacterized protein LOC106873077 [Octopus bimaculoides]|eukprot:XP_014775784.1 PREDICTED: uncharacterized protein LOC106873077 [Octopus bimaculoides]
MLAFVMATSDGHANLVLCSHSDANIIDTEHTRWLAEFLPENYKHHICNIEIVEKEVKVTMRLAVSTREGAKEWLESMQKSSLSTFRVERTYPSSGEKVLFKTEFRCQHNTKPRTATADQRKGSKNTNCPAGLSIVGKVSTFEKSDGKKRKCRSSDPHMPDHPMIVKFKCTHNHPLRAEDALKHRDVSEEVKVKFLELFNRGYTPSKALELHKYDLQLQHSDNYIFISADRSITPDLQYCYRLYYQTFKKEYGEAKGEFILEELKRKIEEGSFGDDIKLSLVGPEGKQAAIAIVTPLMRRVHKLIKHSGELVFIDASGNMNRQGCRVFLLLTHSCAGGLPLGVLITTSESTETITEALKLYNSLLDNSAYFGRGWKSGPEIFLTDDSPSESQSLHAVYPDATLLHCVFHILQAFWRFLLEAKNAVRKEDRPHLFSLLKDMIYCDTIEALKAKHGEIMNDETLKRYACVQKHLEDIYAKKTSWAVCYRVGLNVRNNTNNYAETAMRIMKDQILERTRAYNMIQLVDFIVTRMETYYERRLIDVCNNRLDKLLQSRFLPDIVAGSKIDPNEIVGIANSKNLFMVPSETDDPTTYMVDIALGVCQCRKGITGGPCKHQYLVFKKLNILSCWNFIPVNDPSMRELLYEVATGCSNVPKQWFLSPNCQNEPDQVDTNSITMESMNNIKAEPHCADSDDNCMESNNQKNENDGADCKDMEISDGCTSKPSTEDGSDPIINELNKAFLALQESYAQDKEFFGGPVQKFTKQLLELTSGTDIALASALHWFGWHSDVARKNENI